MTVRPDVKQFPCVKSPASRRTDPLSGGWIAEDVEWVDFVRKNQVNVEFDEWVRYMEDRYGY